MRYTYARGKDLSVDSRFFDSDNDGDGDDPLLL